MHDFFDVLPHIYKDVMTETLKFLQKARVSLIEAQRRIIQEKEHRQYRNEYSTYILKDKIDVKLSHIPFSVHTYILGLSDIGPENIDRLGIYKGTVIKCTQTKSLEKKKVFKCTDCGTEYECEAEIQSDNSFKLPPGCENLVMKDRKNTGFVSNMMKKFNLAPQNQGYGSNGTGFEGDDAAIGGLYKKKREMCNGTRWEEKAASQVHVDYQEIKIQEQFETIKPGKIPSNMWVILENSLVDKCSPGDDVLICGVPTPRIKKTKYKERPEAQLVLVANTIQLRNNEHAHSNKLDSKQTPNNNSNLANTSNAPNPQSSLRFEKMFELYWKDDHRTMLFELETRNNMIESLCPHLFGKLDVKLAMLLTIIGGVTSIINNTRIRGQSHMLIIGEPGTGKSQLLRGAHELSYRAVYTNGIGSTSAGLTVSLSKEGNEWMMEAGALVISDLGICCIDEFNLIKNQDYKAVHEAMEQQTVSMSKAGLYCKVNTRASILAACNPVTAGQKYNTAVNYMENSGLTSPLISRFDIVFVMTDKQTDASKSAEYVLNGFKAVKKQKQLMSAYMSATNTQSSKSGAFPKEVWTSECVREYIRHIQTTIQPLIEDDADRILREYFKHLRNITTYGQKTVRTLESLVRLTQAHARLMHRDRCTIFDAVSVIVLMESASSTGLLDDAEKYIHLDSEEEYNEVEVKVLTPLGLCFEEECEIIDETGGQ